MGDTKKRSEKNQTQGDSAIIAFVTHLKKPAANDNAND